jgi:hypothetical protein
MKRIFIAVIIALLGPSNPICFNTPTCAYNPNSKNQIRGSPRSEFPFAP